MRHPQDVVTLHIAILSVCLSVCDEQSENVEIWYPVWLVSCHAIKSGPTTTVFAALVLSRLNDGNGTLVATSDHITDAQLSVFTGYECWKGSSSRSPCSSALMVWLSIPISRTQLSLVLTVDVVGSTSRPRQDSGCNVGQAPYVRRPCQCSLQVGTLSHPGDAPHSPCHHWRHGEVCCLRTHWVKSRFDYANSCYVWHVIEQRRPSSTCTERRCPSSRLGFQAAINKLVRSSETLTLAADRVSHQV